VNTDEAEDWGPQGWDRDIAELGMRVACCLTGEQFGTLYSELRDRAWSVVLNCYGYMAVQAPGEAERWLPQFDEHGMWRMP